MWGPVGYGLSLLAFVAAGCVPEPKVPPASACPIQSLAKEEYPGERQAADSVAADLRSVVANASYHQELSPSAKGIIDQAFQQLPDRPRVVCGMILTVVVCLAKEPDTASQFAKFVEKRCPDAESVALVATAGAAPSASGQPTPGTSDSSAPFAARPAGSARSQVRGRPSAAASLPVSAPKAKAECLRNCQRSCSASVDDTCVPTCFTSGCTD
jgi:hypothetical protein